MNNAESIKTKSILFTLFLGVVLGATFATGFLAWITFESTDELAELQDRHKEIVSLQGIVTHYDEVLTMSARMAAATGDMKWERRYRQFESVLDQTIKKLISLQPNETSSVKATDEANAELVKMENEALLLVKKNKKKEAFQILFSPEYEKQKKIYTEGTEKFNRNLVVLLDHQWTLHRERIHALKMTLFIFLTLSFFGWIFIFRRARQWNRELLHNNESLDQQVKEKTALLLQSSKMSALGEMAGGVAHEINTPLAIIKLKVEQLEDCIKDEGGFEPVFFTENVEVIKKTVERIAKIVKGLQFFARDEKKTGATQTILVSKLIEETLSICGERFSNQGIQLQVKKNPSYETLCVDGRAIELSQVLINLLNNAFDAVEHLPERWIHIEAHIKDDSSIEISIRDSGRGVPKEIQDKIMQPFFTTKEIGKGTGLGLSISRGIILSQGGNFYLDVNDPHTKFVIQLSKAQAKVSVAV